MPNIMINSYCNLKCPYCFADNEITDCSTKNMSIDGFEEIIEWHHLNKLDGIRIIGGEPTLNPNFIDFIYRILADDKIKHLHIFSNMTFGEEVKNALIDFQTEKSLSFLPNFNEAIVIGQKYDLVKKNIKIFSNLGNIQTLGINIYKHNYDFADFFELAEDCNIKDIRWSLVTPNFKITKDFNVKKYFNEYFDTLIKFFKICNEKKMNNHQDCNSIPMCSFSDSQIKQFLLHKPDLFAKHLACDVVLDINPNLEVFRCFGLSEDYKEKLNKKIKIEQYCEILKNETAKLEKKILFEDCIECEIYKLNNNSSCSCINYRKEK